MSSKMLGLLGAFSLLLFLAMPLVQVSFIGSYNVFDLARIQEDFGGTSQYLIVGELLIYGILAIIFAAKDRKVGMIIIGILSTIGFLISFFNMSSNLSSDSSGFASSLITMKFGWIFWIGGSILIIVAGFLKDTKQASQTSYSSIVQPNVSEQQCPNCKKMMRSNQSSCPHCGQIASVSLATRSNQANRKIPENKKVKCKKCGQSNNRTARYCIGCGEDL